jgi:hypothetical protein
MHMATTVFPLKAGTPNKSQRTPHHLWPKSVLHDIHAIRNRIKALRRLAALKTASPHLTRDSLAEEDSPHHNLWLRVTSPLTLRAEASPPRYGTKRHSS